jgi:ATP phosphoribosyltransferase
MLRLVLPKGSLEKATLELFEQADLSVHRSSDVDYRGTIDDPRVVEVKILRPQEIPRYVADGLFDLGITGRDWIEETGADVVSLGELHYSKASARPINVVVAVAEDSPARSVRELASVHKVVRVSTEYPALTGRYFEAAGVEAEVMLSYGATEAKIPDIADAVVEITETGRALRAANLRVIETILVSYTELIANRAAYDDPTRRHAMAQLHTLLSGTLEARGKVLVKLNVAEASLASVIAMLPSMKSPTVSKLFGGDDYAVETVVPKAIINTLIPELKDAGATDIIELPLAKIVH